MKFDTENEKIRKDVDSNQLFDLISETANVSAEPGIQFIDKLRDGTMSNALYKSTGDKTYKIISTNACSENAKTGRWKLISATTSKNIFFIVFSSKK